MAINTFTKFQALLNPSARTVVTITANNGDGTSDATTSTNVTVTVVGEQVPVGQKAFVENGQVLRQAPNLTVTELNI